MGSPADELVEVVDADGNVERVVTRAEMRAQNLPHRNIAVVVQRSDGRLVVHQRADWKDVYPSLWDVAFGGVPCPKISSLSMNWRRADCKSAPGFFAMAESSA